MGGSNQVNPESHSKAIPQRGLGVAALPRALPSKGRERAASRQAERSLLGPGCCLPMGLCNLAGVLSLVSDSPGWLSSPCDPGVRKQCLHLTGGQGVMPKGEAMNWAEPHPMGINPCAQEALPGCPRSPVPSPGDLYPPFRGSDCSPPPLSLHILFPHFSS